MIVEVFVVHYEDGTHTIYGDTRSADRAAAEGGGCVERFIPEAPLRARLRASEAEVARLTRELEECETKRTASARLNCDLVAQNAKLIERNRDLGDTAAPWDAVEYLEKEKADG